MHEFSICGRIVDVALEEAGALDASRGKVIGVRVAIGGMHQIVPDFLETAWDVLTRDTALGGSAMHLRFIPVAARCIQCGWEGAIEPPLFQCGACSEFHVEVTQGNELFLEGLEVEEDAGRND